MKIRIATKDDLPQIEKLWQDCFADPQEWLDWFLKKRFDKSLFLGCFDGNKLAAMVHMARYTLLVRDKKMPSATFAGFATDKAYRGQGLNTKLILELSEYAHDLGVTLMFHTPNKISRHYPVLHYEGADRIFATIKTKEHDSPYAVEYTPDMFEQLHKCYKRYSKFFSGIVHRDKAKMQMRLDDYFADNGKVIVVTNGERVTGYAIYLDKETLDAEEIVNEDDQSLQILFDTLIRNAAGKTVTVVLPRESMPAVAKYEFTLESYSLINAIDVSKALAILDLDTPYTIGVEDNVLPWNEGVYTTMGEKTGKKPDIVLNAGRLAQMIIGYKTIYELIAAKEVVIKTESAIEGIDRAFSRKRCYIFEKY